MKGILKRAAAVALALALAVALLASCSGSRTLLTVDGAAVTEEIMNYYVYISTSIASTHNCFHYIIVIIEISHFLYKYCMTIIYL